MVDLEKSFAEWRWQMLAAGITAPDPLEELELHLREEVERQVQSTADAGQAFAAAVRRLGPPGELRREFSRAGRPSPRLGWLWLAIGAFGLGQTAILNFVGPVVFHRHSSAFFSPKWWANWSPAYVVWIAFILVGSTLGLAGLRSQRRAAGR